MSLVLVVEDDRVSSELQKFILEHDGLQVVTAADGNDALKKVDEAHPDLVVLDVILPGLDGFQICQLLKHSIKTKNIPVVFVTSKYRKEDEQMGMDLGANDYIRKPFDPDDYLVRVKKLLGQVLD
ncbi:MAG: response regulator [Candidatus Saganbacteria bacterium]|nr:response regulator [Candidatus Saganbacteria bacterium]